MTEMRALSVRQPWAGCIVHLGKDCENRSRPVPPKFIGDEIAVHASLGVDDREVIQVPDGDRWATLFAGQAEWDAWRLYRLYAGRRDVANWPPKLALGAVVGVATVTACHWWEDCWAKDAYGFGVCSNWASMGQWHWTLTGQRALPEPVPCRGMLGLWRLPEDAEKAVREQLEASRG